MCCFSKLFEFVGLLVISFGRKYTRFLKSNTFVFSTEKVHIACLYLAYILFKFKDILFDTIYITCIVNTVF